VKVCESVWQLAKPSIFWSDFDGTGQERFAISKWEFSVAGLRVCILVRRDPSSHEMRPHKWFVLQQIMGFARSRKVNEVAWDRGLLPSYQSTGFCCVMRADINPAVCRSRDHCSTTRRIKFDILRGCGRAYTRSRRTRKTKTFIMVDKSVCT